MLKILQETDLEVLRKKINSEQEKEKEEIIYLWALHWDSRLMRFWEGEDGLPSGRALKLALVQFLLNIHCKGLFIAIVDQSLETNYRLPSLMNPDQINKNQ